MDYSRTGWNGNHPEYTTGPVGIAPDGCHPGWFRYNSSYRTEGDGRWTCPSSWHDLRVFQNGVGSPFENGEGLVAILTGPCILHSMMKQEIELSKYHSMTMEELGSYVSDYHKDVHGFRPRGDGLYANRDALVLIAEGLDAYMAARRSTFSGRESMRADGWVVLETDPELIQRSIWIAEERDAVHREATLEATDRGERVFWTESMAEAPSLRRQYGKE
jgi:hypothetical protein